MEKFRDFVTEKQNRTRIVALSIMLIIAIIFCSFLFTADGDQNETTTISSIFTKTIKETTPAYETKTIKETTEKAKGLCCLNILIISLN